jgi:hypothetical protein
MTYEEYEKRRQTLYLNDKLLEKTLPKELEEQLTRYGDWYDRRIASNELKYRNKNEQNEELEEV